MTGRQDERQTPRKVLGSQVLVSLSTIKIPKACMCECDSQTVAKLSVANRIATTRGRPHAIPHRSPTPTCVAQYGHSLTVNHGEGKPLLLVTVL